MYKGNDLPKNKEVKMTKPINLTKVSRNLGSELDLDWVLSTQANTSAIERRANSIGARRSIKKQHQAAWLIKAITLIAPTLISSSSMPNAVVNSLLIGFLPLAQSLSTRLSVSSPDKVVRSINVIALINQAA